MARGPDLRAHQAVPESELVFAKGHTHEMHASKEGPYEFKISMAMFMVLSVSLAGHPP